MWVGHYGVSFAAKRLNPRIPMWILFIAVQLLDFIWSPLVIFGVERLRIVRGITALNALDLYYMPYSHSFVSAVILSIMAAGAYLLFDSSNRQLSSALVVSFAVLSHWLLDLVVHRPDLPLYGNILKIGFGLWNFRVLAFGIEISILLIGIFVYARKSTNRTLTKGAVIFGLFLTLLQAGKVFWGHAPSSPIAAATAALLSYLCFTLVAVFFDSKKTEMQPSAT